MSAKKDLRFDPALLDSMSEPLSVRVEKVRGGNRMPIDLPARDADMAPGVGWDKDSVRRLESWLVNDWSGGGLYNFVVVDSSGRKMEWQAIYDPREFPEKMPPTMQASTVQPAMASSQRASSNVAAPPVQQQNTGPIGGGGIWPPPGFSYMPAPSYAQPQQQQAPQQQQMPQQQQYPMMQPVSWPWPSFPQTQVVQQPPPPAAPAATPIRQNMFEQDLPRRRARFLDDEEAEKKQLEQKIKDAEEKFRQAEKEKLEADYKSQLERAKQEQDRQLETLRLAQAQQAAALQEEIRRMREAQVQAQNQPAPPGPNPELEALKEERAKIERERERMDRENREAREKADRESRDAKEKAEREARDAREKADREMKESKEREETNRRFEALQNLIAKLAETPKPTGPDPAFLALQEQFKSQQEEARRVQERYEAERLRERDKMEQDRRERDREEKARIDREAIKEDLKRRDDDAKRREDLLLAQLNDVKSNANRGPDPLILAMQESSRSQIDAMKELMRVQQTNTDRMQTFMMSPRDILAMQKENSGGLDDLKKDIIGTYKDVFDMQRELMMQAANMNQGGESPTMRLVEEGLKRAGDLADRYFKGKRDEIVSTAKVQEAAVNLQAHQAQAYAIQQSRMAEMARREEAVRQTAAVASGGGLNGAGSGGGATAAATVMSQPVAIAQEPKPKKKKNGANGNGQHKVETKADPYTEELKQSEAKKSDAKAIEVLDDGLTDPTTGQTISLEEHRKKIAKVTRYGKTDEEWFGEALDHVKGLRSAVDEFIKSLQAEPKRIDPKTGEIVGASPEQSVEFLIRAVNFMFAQNIRVPAVTDLFMQDRFAELLDILIPEAPQGYRDDCVKILYAMAEEAQKEDGAPEVEDDEEDEDGEDDE